jgi:hypothetical protein
MEAGSSSGRRVRGLTAALRSVLPVVALVSLGAAIAFGPGAAVRRGENDFLAFYSGGRLLGNGQLYDVQASWKLHQELVGKVMPALVFVRLPVFALPYVALAKLPYLMAYWLFQSLSVLALLGSVALLARRAKEVPYLAALSLPALCALGSGQEVTFLMLILALALVLLDRDRDFAAGLLLSLCAVKFHLLWLLPLGLVIDRRWKTLAGGAVGGAALVGASFVVAGANWPRQFLALISSPGVHPNLGAMGSLHGLLYAFAAEAAWWRWLVYLVPVALFVYLAWRTRDPRIVLGYALVAGLLTGGHAYIHDFALLLVAYAVLAEDFSKPLRMAFQLLLLPFVYYGLIAGAPYNTLVPLALVGLMAGWTIHKQRAKYLI